MLPLNVKILDAFQCKNQYITEEEEKLREDDQFASKENPIPIFSIDLVLKEGSLLPEYNILPYDIVATVMSIFDKGLLTLQ